MTGFCFHSIGAGSSSSLVTAESFSIRQPQYQWGSLQAHTHKQPLGPTVLCNPTFHLTALRDGLRLHRSLHASFDVPRQKKKTKSKPSIKFEHHRWRLAQRDFTGRRSPCPLKDLSNKSMCRAYSFLNHPNSRCSLVPVFNSFFQQELKSVNRILVLVLSNFKRSAFE